MPPITILPCTITDAPAIAINNLSAFWPNRAWALIWTRVGKTLPYVISQQVLRMPHSLLLDPARKRHQKAVNEKGELTGYCRWVLPKGADAGLWGEAKVEDAGEERREEFKRDFEGADWKYDTSLDEVDKPVAVAKERLMGGKNYVLLDYLAVHPDHRKQGIATELAESGLREVKKMGLDAFVVSKNAGLHVYERAGFKLLETVAVDYSEFGHQEAQEFHFLEYKVTRE